MFPPQAISMRNRDDPPIGQAFLVGAVASAALIPGGAILPARPATVFPDVVALT